MIPDFMPNDYRTSGRDLYKDAQEFGEGYKDVHPTLSAGYWTAWYAARRSADALLAEAQEFCTPDQWERLRKVAAFVSYD